jgi:hypothetical protein
MLVYVQITNLLAYHGNDSKPGVGRILHKDNFTDYLVLACFSALVLGLALLTPKLWWLDILLQNFTTQWWGSNLECDSCLVRPGLWAHSINCMTCSLFYLSQVLHLLSAVFWLLLQHRVTTYVCKFLSVHEWLYTSYTGAHRSYSYTYKKFITW